MIHKKSTKIIAGLLCCVLCILTAVFSVLAVVNRTIGNIKGLKTYADGFVMFEDNDDVVEISRMDESFFAPTGDNYFKYNEEAKDWLMPGGSKSGSLTVQNKSDRTLTIYLSAESTGPTRLEYLKKAEDPDAEGPFTPDDDVYQEYKDFVEKNYSDLSDDQALIKAGELQEISNALVDELDLKIYKNGTGDPELVYDGKLRGDEMRITMSSLKPNEQVEFNFTLTAPVTLGNEYSGGMALIDWIFDFTYSEAPSQTTTTTTPTTTTTTTKYTPPTPKTGEAAIPYAVAAGLCGFSALAIFFIAFGNIGKKRKEEE